MRNLVISVFCAVVICLSANSALACSCIKQELDQQISQADIIFVGEALSASRTVGKQYDFFQIKPYDIELKFRVIRSLKNSENFDFLFVSAPEQSGMCGISGWSLKFQKKSKWLVFASLDKFGKYQTRVCDPSRQTTNEAVEAMEKAISAQKKGV